MTANRPHRPIFFFLAAVLLPCAVLVLLSVRMIQQDRELAEKRIADEAQRAVAGFRQELLTRLGAIKSGEIEHFAETGKAGRAEPRTNEPVALLMRIEQGQPVLPWEVQTLGGTADGPRAQEPFAAKVREGEQREFAAGDFQEAAASYAEATRLAGSATQRAEAKLMLARASLRGGEREKAVTLYSALLELPDDIVGPEAVPLFLYAAKGLLDLDAGQQAVFERIEHCPEDSFLKVPAATYLAADLLETLEQSDSLSVPHLATSALGRLRGHLSFFEQILALQRDFPALGLGRVLSSGSREDGPLWVPYGEALWLVSVAESTDDATPVMVALRADVVLGQVIQSGAWGDGRMGVPEFHSDGLPLGPAFPGLAVAFTMPGGGSLAQETGLRRWFYPATLGLLLSVTLFVAYLLWRDVHRELRLAGLRSQFVSSVSHELRTPLTAIRMFAETLSLGRVENLARQREYLATIVNESQRLTRLLNNVLDFSKIEQGRKTYRLEPTCLAGVVEAAARAMQYPLEQHGFRLQVEIEENLPVVEADADAIEQAILNLLSNAMKYSGDAREIDLKLTRRDGDVVIQVTDQGIGIPRDQQDRVFEKFYRAPAVQAEGAPGTGLGLTLVQHIARAHGGEALVESEPGKGSTFSVRIPIQNPS